MVLQAELLRHNSFRMSWCNVYSGSCGEMNKKQALAIAFLAVLLASSANANQARAQNQPQPQADMSFLAMPEEYLNYTITPVNGTIWALIDGTYPMHLTSENGAVTQLPMWYPTPPNTTNIHVILDDAELSWSNYSEADPTARHHTAIGDWEMIYCTVAPASADFVLKIHYEHPVEVINRSYTFLYDLNISPYLSPQTPKSTAHFNIRIEVNHSGVNVFRTGSDDAWTPINYTSARDGNTQIVTFDIVSQYDKPLLGDIAVTLADAQVPEFPLWTAVLFLVAATAAILIASRNRCENKKPESST